MPFRVCNLLKGSRQQQVGAQDKSGTAGPCSKILKVQKVGLKANRKAFHLGHLGSTPRKKALASDDENG